MSSPLLEGKSREELLDLARSFHWWHSIDLGGVVTSGTRSPLHARAFDQVDFTGKKVLDIGCWDGLWSFEAERRGAREVYSVDYVSLRSWSEQPTYQLAHKLLGSRAKYYPNVSVYDIESLGVADFDVVVYCGIYYHLLDPLRAFAALRAVMVEGGQIIVEGPVLDGSAKSFANFYCGEWLVGDPTNWWVPTITCLKEWLDCTFFDATGEISGKRDFSPAAPVTTSGRRDQGGGSALQRIRTFFRGVGKGPAPSPEPVAAESQDRYVVIARATSVAERLARQLTGRKLEPLPAGAAVRPVAGFCAAASAFHELKPWQRIRDDVTIKLECAGLGNQPVFVMVLGAGSRHHGLAIYFDRIWLTLTRQGSLPGERITWAPFLALLFAEEASLPPGEAALLRANGWTATDGSFPLAVVNEAHGEKTREIGNKVRRASPAELQVLEGCCRALPAFIGRHSALEAATEDLAIGVEGGELRMKLSWMPEGGREL